MRGVLYVFSILFITSCSKDSSDPAEKSSLQYKANGSLFTYNDLNEIKITKQNLTAGSSYKSAFYLEAQKEKAQIDLRFMSKTSAAIAVENYTLTAPVIEGSTKYSVGEGYFDGTDYIDKTGDYSNVTITKLDNGYASGTFSARLTLVTGTTQLLITEGTFKHLRIIQ
jgi:hypothetical protein